MLKKTKKKPIIIIICFILFITGNILGIIYVSPKVIHHKYYGIEFQSGNPDFSKQVLIEINGHFKRKLWGFNDREEFVGTIVIDGVPYSSGLLHNRFVFDNSYGNWYGNNYGYTVYGQNREGDLYKRGMLEEIAILFFEPDGHLSLDSVRVIAGPCNSREEAVKLANSFIDKRYTTLIE